MGRSGSGTSIERRLSEIAIITIGARWQAEFEWWAHAPMAREHGVADAVVDAIGRGEDPPTARRLPFGPQATAWEVAYATVWLLSGESSYVNAHPLVLDGGATSFG